jgi:hypothetical protein
MRLFKCAVCSQLLYFENTRCERCGHVLGYEPGQNRLLSLETDGDEWRDTAEAGAAYAFCANSSHGVCNWLVPAGSSDGFCLACRHNGMIPDLSLHHNAANWQKIESAKHRLFYTLLRLRLPLQTRAESPQGLLFNFLADSPVDPNSRVMTGHDSGLITLAVSEADDAERERRRSLMGEPYRTLLGHFRHEVGHYFWDRLVRDRNDHARFRIMFGDETVDYLQGLERYYQSGAPNNWQDNYVSAYATSHPWEDFAETFAHYLHILDTMEMARAFNLHVAPRIDNTGALEALIDFDPYKLDDFAVIVDNWLPISFAMNNINRCMGQPDLYPFVLSPAVVDKLSFVHRLVGATTRSAKEIKQAV